MSGRHRSTREIRKSLAETRQRVDDDMEELEGRLHDSLDPREIFARHPTFVTIAGVILGVLVVRHPALIGRGIARVAQLGAPLLLKKFFSKE